MDRYLIRLTFVVLLTLTSQHSWGACPLADFYFKRQNDDAAVFALHNCALYSNDDESQMRLAEAYTEGKYGLEKDEEQVLYFYQLASEAGNAEAQLALAEKLIQMDRDKETRSGLINYQKKMVIVDEDKELSFDGSFMHPYALLMLATESPENKWYYPSMVRVAQPRATTLLKTFKISDKKKKEAMKQASQFKTRKLLQTAKEVVPASEYPQMAEQLKSPKTQKQALEELKTQVNIYIEKKKNLNK